MGDAGRTGERGAMAALSGPSADFVEIFNHPNAEAVRVPRLGFGVFQVAPSETEEVVQCALAEGYRHIDTAQLFRNEAAVGKAIRASGIPREDIFVTTKLWSSDFGYEAALQAFNRSLSLMNLDYVDLYLVHSPMRLDARIETWRAFETILRSGKARSIGVSNYGIHHLEELFEHCTIRPAVNQVELHPFNSKVELVSYCQRRGIAVQAYSPLTKGRRLKDPVLVEMASRYKVSPAQLLIRWSLQKGYIPLPRSSNPAHIAANAQVYSFEIVHADVYKLDLCNEDYCTGWDPTRVP